MTEEEKKAKRREYHAKYYEKLKNDPERYAKYLAYCSAYQKARRENDKEFHDKHLAVMNEYNANHREERRAYWYKYSSDPENKEKIKAKNKAYREKRRKEIREYSKNYNKKRKEQNICN